MVPPPESNSTRRQPPPIPPPPLPNRQSLASSLLNAEELSRFKNLLVFAKTVVEGYFVGRHRSPDFGSTCEFADYRPYVEGDSIQNLDWRVYARTGRLYSRLYEDETDMCAYLMVDMSGSMAYQGAGQEPKLLRSARIAAAISYLMHRQGDKFALTLFDQKIRNHIPAGGARRHLLQVLQTLEREGIRKPHGATQVDSALEEAGGIYRKKGRLVILSDFLTDTDRLFDALSQFVHRGFEILLLQVLDPWERNLPDIAMAEFVDMETGEQVEVNPAEIRAHYQERIQRLVEELGRECVRRRISYKLLDTDQPYLEAIEQYLGFRRERKK